MDSSIPSNLLKVLDSLDIDFDQLNTRHIKTVLNQGERELAIWVCRKTTGKSLDESEAMIARMEHGEEIEFEKSKVTDSAPASSNDKKLFLIQNHIINNELIEAIKLYRQFYGGSLKWAKEQVEKMAKGDQPSATWVPSDNPQRKRFISPAEIKKKMRKRNKSFSIVGGIFFTIGILMLIGSLFYYAHRKEFSDIAIRTEGDIKKINVEVSTSTDDDGNETTSYSYRPVVQFRLKHGVEHTVPSETTHGSNDYRVGNKYPMLYDPADPNLIREDSFKGLWGDVLFVAGMGFFFFIFGGTFIGVALFSRKL